MIKSVQVCHDLVILLTIFIINGLAGNELNGKPAFGSMYVLNHRLVELFRIMCTNYSILTMGIITTN